MKKLYLSFHKYLLYLFFNVNVPRKYWRD